MDVQRFICNFDMVMEGFKYHIHLHCHVQELGTKSFYVKAESRHGREIRKLENSNINKWHR